MHFKRITTLALISLGTILSSCDDKGPSDPHSENENGESPSNRIDIPASVRNNLGITFAKVERRAVADTLRVPGSFELEPLAKHEYRLMVPARIRFETNELQTVTPGTLLYRFQSPEWLKIQSRIELAVAAQRQTQLKYEALTSRIEALAKADFKRADLDTEATALKSEMASRDAELNAALISATNLLNAYRSKDKAFGSADLLADIQHQGKPTPLYRSIDWIEARAIEPGVVKSLAVTDGSYVDASSRVLTTVDPKRVRFRALGLQGDLEKFQQSTMARIVPHQAQAADLNEALPATLTLGLDGHPRERTLTLFAHPSELRPWARPGISAFLEIVTQSSNGPVLAIPRSAVVMDGINHVFFKRDPMNANKAIRVEADLGINDGRWLEIKSGLGPNDEVVLEGAYELKLASAQSGTSQKGGHFHADGTYHDEH